MPTNAHEPARMKGGDLYQKARKEGTEEFNRRFTQISADRSVVFSVSLTVDKLRNSENQAPKSARICVNLRDDSLPDRLKPVLQTSSSPAFLHSCLPDNSLLVRANSCAFVGGLSYRSTGNLAAKPSMRIPISVRPVGRSSQWAGRTQTRSRRISQCPGATHSRRVRSS